MFWGENSYEEYSTTYIGFSTLCRKSAFLRRIKILAARSLCHCCAEAFKKDFIVLWRSIASPTAVFVFFTQIGLRSLQTMGRFQNHVAARRVSNHDNSLRACFLALCRCFFACLGSMMMCCTTISIQIGLWTFLFSTVIIIVILVIQTLKQHTAFLVLTYTYFVCWYKQ